MNRNTITATFFALVFLGGQSALAQSGYDFFQKGLVKERAEGDLDEAIRLYQQIVEDHKDDRALVAKALVQMGGCYEKLGRAEARKAYETVVREFADQAEPARVAREHLEQLDGGAPGEVEGRLVWTYPRLMMVMAPSPDGRYLAFRDAETGDLAVRELETEKNRRLTHNEVPFEGTTEDARFSPDGRWIAYNWYHNEDDEEEADLRIIGTDGSRLRVVYQPDGRVKRISPYAWFPDGKQILGRLRRDDGKRQAVVVSVSDGSVRVLEAPDRDFGNLSLSPNGRYIAYDCRPNGSRNEDIALFPVDGGEEVPVIVDPADDDLLGWAPDGRTLLFRSDRRGEGDDAWVIQIIDGKPQGLPQLVKKGIDNEGAVENGQFTRDGSFYYAVAKALQRQPNVYIASLDPKTGTVLADPARVSQCPGGTTGPGWSPDGEYLVYMSQLTMTPWPYRLVPRLMVIRSIETGQEREIPLETKFGRFHGYSIRWSPDGRSILADCFDSLDSGTWRGGLLQLDVASGKITSIVPISDGHKWPAGWSPDGKRIFYARAYLDQSNSRLKYTSCEIVVRNLETGREKELYRVENTSLGHVALSPNGRQLAFASSWPSAEALMVMPAEGGKPRELCRVQEGVIDPGVVAWTPDGRYVLFGKRPQGPGIGVAELWRIPAEGGKPQKLELATGVGSFKTLRVHPDGKRIAFISWRLDEELRALKDFLPELASPTVQLPDPPEGNYFVTRSEDDAEEYNAGDIGLDNTDLDLGRKEGEDGKVVGIRFVDIRIPRGTRVKKAYLQFVVYERDAEPTDVTIHAELAASAKVFSETEHDISSRKVTKASVKWSPERWGFEGQRSQKQQSPDLSSLIQEVIDQSDWQEGNALVLIISGSGDRDAISFDGGGQRYAPMLHIE